MIRVEMMMKWSHSTGQKLCELEVAGLLFAATWLWELQDGSMLHDACGMVHPKMVCKMAIVRDIIQDNVGLLPDFNAACAIRQCKRGGAVERCRCDCLFRCHGHLCARDRHHQRH